MTVSVGGGRGGAGAGAALFAGPGEMRAYCRAFDWAATPLGPVEGWAVSLRTTVAMLLAARHSMILFWGAERIQLYNDASVPVLGGAHRHPAALGMRAAECWTGEVWRIVGPQIEQVLATGEATWHEDQYVPLPRHGRVETTYWTYGYVPAHDDAGRPAGVLVITQETTRRVRTERAFERLLDAAPAVMALYSGPNHVISYVNPTWERVVGKPGALGRPFREVFPEMAGTGLFEQLDHAYRTGERYSVSELCLPIQRWPQGPVEESYWDIVWQPAALTGEGAGGGATEEGDIICHAVDVTDQVRARHQAERLLAESEAAGRAFVELEAQFRAVQEASPDASILARAVRGEDGRIHDFVFTYANSASRPLLLGRDEQIVGRTMREAFPESVAAGRLERYAHVVETGELWLEDVRYHRGPVAHGLRVTAVRVGDGVHIGAVDLSQRIQAAEERERLLEAAEAARREAEGANRAKSEFLAVMSHELRTPLNAIGGYAELIELGIHGPVTPEQRAALERIQRSQRHLLGLINGVLNYAKVDAGAVHYAVEEVRLGEVLATCEALVAPQVRGSRLTLAYAGCDGRLAARADREKVRQVILNLLSNAVKFTDPGGRITLDCASDGAGRVVVRVADSGRGIAADQLERIFQPFVQVDARLTRTQDGTGLGLAISRDLARGMGGELTAESELGVGSTFTLVLPTG